MLMRRRFGHDANRLFDNDLFLLWASPAAAKLNVVATLRGSGLTISGIRSSHHLVKPSQDPHYVGQAGLIVEVRRADLL
jgi:hypothetical protein